MLPAAFCNTTHSALDLMSIRAVIAAFVLCTPVFAHADCTAHLNEWAQALSPGRTIDANNAACKAWPQNPAQTLAVLPLPQKGATEDKTVYDVQVLVADSKTGAIIAHSYEPSAITSDAISLRGIALDTAHWQLAPHALAFGVRKSYEGSSRVNPFAATTLSLYVVDGSNLRRVLANLTTQQSNGEWDGNCSGQFSDITRVISVGPAGQGAYATLHISEKTVDSTHAEAAGQCATKNKATKQANVTLAYDGAHYGVPAALRFDQ
ncbi:PA3715 family protein [Paralcaligenes ginsengisoli]